MSTRVATFNLLHGLVLPQRGTRQPPTADPAALRAAAEALDADVVGLQEVDHAQPRSHGADQTAVVAAALGARHWRFVATVHGTPGLPAGWDPAPDHHVAHAGHDVDPAADGPAYGIGLVSRLPVADWRVLRFPAARATLPLLVPTPDGPRVVRVPDEPRAALAAVVDGPSGPFTVVTAHLSFVPVVNARQLRAVARWTVGLPEPVVLAGDLNLPGPAVRTALRWRTLARGATYPAPRPRVQLDHLLGRGLPPGSVGAGRVHALPVSDHCALSVDLHLAPRA